MFGNNNNKKIQNEFAMLTTVRSAVLYYYNDENEKIIVAILSLTSLTDKNISIQVDRMINDLNQPDDTKMYAAVEGNEYRVY